MRFALESAEQLRGRPDLRVLVNRSGRLGTANSPGVVETCWVLTCCGTFVLCVLTRVRYLVLYSVQKSRKTGKKHFLLDTGWGNC